MGRIGGIGKSHPSLVPLIRHLRSRDGRSQHAGGTIFDRLLRGYSNLAFLAGPEDRGESASAADAGGLRTPDSGANP